MCYIYIYICIHIYIYIYIHTTGMTTPWRVAPQQTGTPRPDMCWHAATSRIIRIQQRHHHSARPCLVPIPRMPGLRHSAKSYLHIAQNHLPE